MARPARPLLVKVGGGTGQGSMTEEPSPALDAVVAGLRRKGSKSKWRGRRGTGMSIVPSAPLSRRKEGGGGEDGAGEEKKGGSGAGGGVGGRREGGGSGGGASDVGGGGGGGSSSE